MTHEVLVCFQGTAEIQFGGSAGPIFHFEPGTGVLLPAGVGHCNRGSSRGFQVVGGYPEGSDYDLQRGQANERPQVLRNIESVPYPKTDPFYGSLGPLFDLWKPENFRFEVS